MSRRLEVAIERFPIAGGFRISRGSRTEAVVVTATLTEGAAVGRGECVPYPRYGETVEAVAAAIEAVRPALEEGADREAVRGLMPPGAARNAVDCALFDLEAKRGVRRAHEIAGLPAPAPVTTAYTISLGTPEEMAAATAREAHRPLLKIKLGGEGDPARIAAVRAAAPQASLMVDANEAWTDALFLPNMEACAAAGVALVEQPLPAGRDGVLANVSRPVPVCADESAHVGGDLAALRARYDAINVKLDKTGGLTEALDMLDRARALDFRIMAGCMVGTSLGIAPAVLVAQSADFVDLDAPLLLARDREPGLTYDGSTLFPPDPSLWG